MFVFDSESFFRAANPLFQSLYPFALIFGFAALVFWFMYKLRACQQKQESFFGLFAKLLVLCFFLFYWQKIYLSFFLFNDAVEAKILEINIEKMLPGFDPAYQNLDNILDNISLFWTDLKPDAQEAPSDMESLTPWQSAWVWIQNIGKKYSEIGKNINPVRIGYHAFLKWGLGFLVTITKKIAVLARIFLSFLFYVSLPFFLIISYTPVLGNYSDKGGINPFSRRMINLAITIAMWPTLYALVDKILLIMFYHIRNQGLFIEGSGWLFAFCCLVVIVYLALPFWILQVNPCGLIYGTLASIGSIGMITSAMAVRGTVGAAALAHSSLPRSNSELSSQSKGNAP